MTAPEPAAPDRMNRKDRRPAVILFSGGLDSTTLARVASEQGFCLHALTFSYGQRHARELEAARDLAGSLGFETHRFIEIDGRAFAGSALTDRGVPVPRGRGADEISAGGIPATYVPARNTIFLSFALAACETLGAEDAFIAVNALDYSGYPDCRPEYLEAFERMARLATRAGVEGGREFRLHAPLIDRTKAQIIRWGLELGVDYSRTWSCYDPAPGGDHCGVCDSCILRRKGFREAGVADPTRYAR
jgi:7-cyano-7-deazaguanine synthase